jgi:hypothetical protein
MRGRALNTNYCWRVVGVALVMLSTAPVWAQRVQFPTMVSSAAYAPGADPAAPAVNVVPQWNAPAAGAPVGGAPTFDPYATSAQPTVTIAPQYSPYTPSPYAPAPGPPYSTTPSALYPDSNPAPMQTAPPGTIFPSLAQPLRLLQELRFRQTFLARGDGNEGFGVTSSEISSTFTLPILYSQTPVLITPGFGAHFLNGPLTGPPSYADLPPVVYDAYLDVAWKPRITNWLSADLGARAGIYSDFHAVNTQSIRIMGRAIALIALRTDLQLAAGVVYLDRNLIKLLPAGGVIWTPNADTRFDIVFPNPKLSHRFTTVGTTDVWVYLAGEYGGGAWTVRRASGASDNFDYNDIRISLGIDAYGASRVRGMAEVGWVLDRQIIYRSGTPQFDPADTVMVRAGLNY